MSFLILDEGRHLPRFFRNKSYEESYPSVALNNINEKFYLGIGFSAENSRPMFFTNMCDRFKIIHAWRAMVFLDMMVCVDGRVMQSCWGLTRSLDSFVDLYRKELSKQIPDPYATRDKILESEIPSENLEHISSCLIEFGLLPNIWELELERGKTFINPSLLRKIRAMRYKRIGDIR